MTKNSSSKIGYTPSPRSVPLSEFIRKEKAYLLEEWENRVRNEFRSASSKEVVTLRNALPIFLENLAASLTSPEKCEGKVAQEAGQAHGEQRAYLGDYSLEEVLNEYFVLLHLILEMADESQRITVLELKTTLVSFETAIREATTEFVRIHYEKLRAEQGNVETLLKESENREQFISLIMHDLKNPLTSAKLSADFLNRQPMPTSLYRTLTNLIAENISRAEVMINDLLELSRIRAGKPFIMKFEPFNLFQLVTRIIQDYSIIYGNRFILNGPDWIQGNWGKEPLRRAIENLLSNAVKYGDSNRPISIDLDVRQHQVYISVHNWGNPIPELEMRTLFRPFQRSTTAQKSGLTGWGLGLVQVKAIVNAHSGEVLVESSIDRGTTFTIRFPC